MSPEPSRTAFAGPQAPSRAATSPAILVHVHDDDVAPRPRRRLDAGWTVVGIPLGAAAGATFGQARDFLFDVDVTTLANARRVRDLLARIDGGGLRIFACRRGDRHAAIQAGALGATCLVDRPFTDAALIRMLAGPGGVDPPATRAEAAGSVALDLAFRSLGEGSRLATERVEAAATSLAAEIGETGLGPWLSSIRAHHAGTYQHCLLVTGIATAFGQELGLSIRDLSTLTVAALLHDIGKARLDPAILDKPGRLSAGEMRLVQMHPVWGDSYLSDHADLPAAVRDAVRHHHEYLDGTGYPDGLSGREIGDLTRLITVADIFGALVERRSYKAPMPAGEACGVLDQMAREGKLETALVDAFRPVAERLRDGGQPGRQPSPADRPTA